MSQRLGEILHAHGSIDAAQLQAALTYQRTTSRPLGEALVQLRLCSEAQVLAALAAQAGLPPIDLDQEALDRGLAGLLLRDAAERFQAVPLRRDERMRALAVAVAAPASPERLEQLREATGAKALQAFLASDQAISRAIARLYSPRQAGQAQPTILVYGWPEDAAKTLMDGFAARDVPGRIAGAVEARAAGPGDIILAPVAAMEALLGKERCPALLIAAAKRAEDFPRAEKLDACSFLLAPLDMDCVVRAIQRCHQLLGIPSRQAA